MSISLSGQLLSLAAGLLLGVGVGLLYDLLRQLRLLAPRRWMAEGLDLLFWLLACLALFLCGILFGGGQVRLYMVLWLTLGATAYFAALSGKMRRLLAALTQGIGKIFRVLLAPLRWFSAVLLGPWIYFFGDAKIFLKKVFSFSAVSSKMYHLVKPKKHSGKAGPPCHGTQEREASSHVPIQTGWSSLEDPLSDPGGVHGAHVPARSSADQRHQKHHRNSDPAGQRPDADQYRAVQRHRKPR